VVFLIQKMLLRFWKECLKRFNVQFDETLAPVELLFLANFCRYKTNDFRN
jgi:hypothetical protein